MMRRTYTAREIIKILKQHGWYEVKSNRKHKKGTSHRKYRHPTEKSSVTVPVHKGRDLEIWEVKGIEEQSGLKLL